MRLTACGPAELERRHVAGFSHSNVPSRQHAGAPGCWRIGLEMAGLTAALLLTATPASEAGTPALHVVRAGSNGTQLLVNGSFNEVQQGKPAPWVAWQQGFRLAPGEGRSGSQCIVCERKEADGEFGASQNLTLNRTNIAPFIIRGWSKAENVSGSPDNGYSLYVDIVYADGSHLWGQTANFNCGTHD
jgi:hypothetical protein